MGWQVEGGVNAQTTDYKQNGCWMLEEEEGGSWECFSMVMVQCWFYLFTIFFSSYRDYAVFLNIKRHVADRDMKSLGMLGNVGVCGNGPLYRDAL